MARDVQPVSVTLGSQPFVCTVCQTAWFRHMQASITLGVGIVGTQTPATALVCLECGYLHMFFNPGLRIWTADQQ